VTVTIATIQGGTVYNTSILGHILYVAKTPPLYIDITKMVSLIIYTLIGRGNQAQRKCTKIHAHPLMDDQDIPYNRYAVEGPCGGLLQLAKRMHSHHTATRSDQAQRKPNH
jgi:hypothetical protein